MSSDKFDETDSTFIEAIRSKRSRCSNFSPQEKNILIHIVEKHETIVESKKTDKQSVLKKERVWDTIAEEFNELLGTDALRTARQLKMCYENLKRRLKKRDMEEKFKQSSVLRPPSSQNDVLSDRRQDSDLDSNSSVDTARPLLEESCVSVPGDKLSRLSTEVFPLSDDAAAPEPGELTDAPGGLANLRQILLKKEIALANLDLEMRAKKYKLELRVQEAKLEYYRRKTALLARMPNGDA